MKAWWLAFGLWTTGLRGARFPLLLVSVAIIPAAVLLLLGRQVLSGPIDVQREAIDHHQSMLAQAREENLRLETILAQLRRESSSSHSGRSACQILPGLLAVGQVKSWRRESTSPAQWNISLLLAYQELTALLARLERCPWLIQSLRITGAEQGVVEAEIRFGEAE